MCKESYAFFFMWQLWKFQPWWPPLTLSPLLSSAWIAARNHASNNSLSVVSGVKWERRVFGHHFGHFPNPFYSFLVGSFLSPAPSFTEEETRKAKSCAQPQSWVSDSQSCAFFDITLGTRWGEVERPPAFESDGPELEVRLRQVV